MHNLLNPLIISLLIIKTELFYLEEILDNNSTDSWPPGYYETILVTTDKFYKVRNKLLRIFTETEIDYILYKLDKNGGDS